jgi:hypothetical protein
MNEKYSQKYYKHLRIVLKMGGGFLLKPPSVVFTKLIMTK